MLIIATDWTLTLKLFFLSEYYLHNFSNSIKWHNTKLFINTMTFIFQDSISTQQNSGKHSTKCSPVLFNIFKVSLHEKVFLLPLLVVILLSQITMQFNCTLILLKKHGMYSL